MVRVTVASFDQILHFSLNHKIDLYCSHLFEAINYSNFESIDTIKLQKVKDLYQAEHDFVDLKLCLESRPCTILYHSNS